MTYEEEGAGNAERLLQTLEATAVQSSRQQIMQEIHAQNVGECPSCQMKH